MSSGVKTESTEFLFLCITHLKISKLTVPVQQDYRDGVIMSRGLHPP